MNNATAIIESLLFESVDVARTKLNELRAAGEIAEYQILNEGAGVPIVKLRMPDGSEVTIGQI